jgi:hypothetical protein
VLNHLRNRIKEIRRNQPNPSSGESFRIDPHQPIPSLWMGALQCMMTKGRPPKFESIPKVTYAVGKLLNGEEVELTAVFHYVERRAWDVIYTFGQSGISQYTFTLSAMIIVLHKQMYFMFSFSQDKTPDIRDMSVTSRQCLFPDERTHCKKRTCRFDLQRAIGCYVADKCSFLCIVLDIHRTETR